MPRFRRARIRKTSELLDQPVGVIVDGRVRGNCYEPFQRALVDRGQIATQKTELRQQAGRRWIERRALGDAAVPKQINPLLLLVRERLAAHRRAARHRRIAAVRMPLG